MRQGWGSQYQEHAPQIDLSWLINDQWSLSSLPSSPSSSPSCSWPPKTALVQARQSPLSWFEILWNIIESNLLPQPKKPGSETCVGRVGFWWSECSMFRKNAKKFGTDNYSNRQSLSISIIQSCFRRLDLDLSKTNTRASIRIKLLEPSLLRLPGPGGISPSSFSPPRPPSKPRCIYNDNDCLYLFLVICKPALWVLFFLLLESVSLVSPGHNNNDIDIDGDDVHRHRNNDQDHHWRSWGEEWRRLWRETRRTWGKTARVHFCASMGS